MANLNKNNDLGFIKIHRKIIDSRIWTKPPLYLKVWLYLLLKAQHTTYKKLHPGQLFTSIPEIIEACSHYVGARKERPTKDQIFQIINWLRKPDEGGHESNVKATMIATTKATHGMLITICNYEYYQNHILYESNNEGNGEKAAKPSRKQRQPDNINKNVKNDNNDNSLLARQKDFFDEVMANKSAYNDVMLQEFYNYWSEQNNSKKKMRWELQPVFEIAKRLATWARKDKSFNRKNNYNGSTAKEPAKEFGDWNDR